MSEWRVEQFEISKCNVQHTFRHDGSVFQTAQKILGPFAPPPIPKGISSEDALESPLSRAEAKLVATFNGQYVAVDLPLSQKGKKQSPDESEPSVSEASVMDSPPSHTPPELPASPVPPSEHYKQEKVGMVSNEEAEDAITYEIPEEALHNEKAGNAVPGQEAEDALHVERPVDAVFDEKMEGAVPEEKKTESALLVENLANAVHDVKADMAEHDHKTEDAAHGEKREAAVRDERPDGIVQSAMLEPEAAQSETAEKHAANSKTLEEFVPQLERVAADIATPPAATSQSEMAPSSARSSVSSVEESELEEALEAELEPEPEPPEPEHERGPEAEEEFSSFSTSEAPLSLLFGTPGSEESLHLPGKPGKGKDQVSLIPGLLPSANLLIVDRNKKSIDAMAFRVPANLSAPVGTRPPSFKSGVIDPDAEKGKIAVPLPPVRVGFWETIRTHPKVARLNRAMDSNVWNSIFIVATLVALFADDVVKGFLPKAADVYEAHVLTACLVLFFLEAAILSIFRDGYFISFFFW